MTTLSDIPTAAQLYEKTASQEACKPSFRCSFSCLVVLQLIRFFVPRLFAVNNVPCGPSAIAEPLVTLSQITVVSCFIYID